MIIYELRRLAGVTKRGGDNIRVETAGWGHQERW